MLNKPFLEVVKINVSDVVTSSTCPVFVEGACQTCDNDF